MTDTPEPRRVPMPMPYLTADKIEYRCWCGYRGTLDEQPEHRKSHKRDLKVKESEE